MAQMQWKWLHLFFQELETIELQTFIDISSVDRLHFTHTVNLHIMCNN